MISQREASSRLIYYIAREKAHTLVGKLSARYGSNAVFPDFKHPDFLIFSPIIIIMLKHMGLDYFKMDKSDKKIYKQYWSYVQLYMQHGNPLTMPEKRYYKS